MSDFLQNPLVKQIAKAVNLPLPIPALLNRNLQPFSDTEIEYKKVTIIGNENELSKALHKILNTKCILTTAYENKFDGIVLNATGIQTIEDTTDFFKEAQRVISKLNKNGRVVVLTKEDSTNRESFAVQNAFEGFTRALSKELGKYGTTANHLRITNAVAENISTAVLFFLSDKSSFITGQVVELNTGRFTKSVTENLLLQDKVAIVTGGARGIGAAVAHVLHREGAKVIIVDVPQASDDANALAFEINGGCFLIDITQNDAAEKIQKYVLDKFGKLDILVNNAGITRDKTLAKMSEQQWNSVMQVNLKATINLTEQFIKNGFTENAKVIGLASISGIAGNVGQTNYSASKAGMIAYMKAIAQTQKNIYANAVAPGFIETKMTESLPLFVKEGGRRLSTLKQGGLPEDVAELIGFLASPLSDGINGNCIRVCGGSMIGA
ncbi:MAG: 3-oxoacyl-ACP reductase [Chitinophagales bacterium]